MHGDNQEPPPYDPQLEHELCRYHTACKLLTALDKHAPYPPLPKPDHLAAYERRRLEWAARELGIQLRDPT